MPVLSGHDAYSQMCAIRPDLVVIFATGYTVELTPNHTLEEGAVFLQKHILRRPSLEPFGARWTAPMGHSKLWLVGLATSRSR
jgi:hypothetical protein